jgi:hypothetical protein
MRPNTAFLSRLIGLYCVLTSLAMFANKQAIVNVKDSLIHSPTLLFIVGIITMMAGLAVVLGHNVWSGGALPVIVSALGWVALVKGSLFLFLPPEAAVGFWEGWRYEQLYYLYAGITFVLGFYLTWAGFRTD